MNQEIPQIITIAVGPHINALLASHRGYQDGQIRNLPSFSDDQGRSYLVIITLLQHYSPHNIYLEGHIGFQDDILQFIDQHGFDSITPEKLGPAFVGCYDSVAVRGTITVS